MVFYYGSTSEVAWLFLLAYWIGALMVVAYFYSLWNQRGLWARFGFTGGEAGPASPVGELPDQVLRSGPLPAPIFEGDRVAVELELNTRGLARGPARLSGFMGATEFHVAAGVVPKAGWKASQVVGAAKRGPVLARGWVLEAGDPLGFFRPCRKARDGEVALVLPLFTSLVARPNVRELEASVAAPRAGSGSELFGVREYQRGDPLRRIHWRSSARRGELVVREYEPPGAQTLGIFCDSSPASPEIADQIARLAASEVWDCVRAGGGVVLWGPGLQPSAPDIARSLWALLEWLARYPSPSGEGVGETDWPAPRVSDAVAITAGASMELIDGVETVRRRGGAIRAWVIGDADLDLDAPVRRVGTSWPL